MQETIDSFLAACVRACLARTAMPPWPPHEAGDIAALVTARIKFHGIALLLAQHPQAFGEWPSHVADAVKDEARLQALWEASHHKAIARLIAAFRKAGISAVAMKGTAIAYGCYGDPAMRRRGDTDLLILHAPRAAARKVLAHSGFSPSGERAITQEPWSIASGDGFEHEIDMHWRINGSVSVSRALERLGFEERIMPLARLSPDACSLGPADNLVLTCVNRYSHRNVGYHVEDARLADGDRLIWALDLKLLSHDFCADDWAQLAERAAASGSASVVRSGLAFAQSTVGLSMPSGFLEELTRHPGDEAVAAYLEQHSSARRFLSELAAASSSGEFLMLLRLWLLPGRDLLASRFPHAQDWPLWALRLRRLVGGVTRRLGLPT